MSETDGTPAYLGRYRIERVLGRGAMGVVYLAFDPHIEREVALKTIRTDPPQSGNEGASASSDLKSRFLNEARAAGRLLHPNIVSVYDYGEAEGEAYLTMEYVRGENLAARLSQHARESTRMAPERVLGWFSQLLDALDYAHEAGVIHRDIKPANLLIAQRGECKITDFGIARLDTSQLTQAGTLIGTPSYMSPEQFSRESIDARADLFSAGVVLYEMLTGVCPFNGTSVEVMQQILNEMPRAPSAVADGIPAALDPIVLRALAKRPEERFASARAWREAVLGVLEKMHDVGDASRTIILAASKPVVLESPSVEAASLPWPPELLAKLEQRLASHIGPMATFLLRRAVARATDSRTLLDLLVKYLPDDRARRELDTLLRSFGVPSKRETASLTAPAPVSQASNMCDQPIDANVIDDTARRLAVYLGPIATVIASRAARKATDTASFHALVADAVRDPDDRAAFRRDLGLLTD